MGGRWVGGGKGEEGVGGNVYEGGGRGGVWIWKRRGGGRGGIVGVEICLEGEG